MRRRTLRVRRDSRAISRPRPRSGCCSSRQARWTEIVAEFSSGDGIGGAGHTGGHVSSPFAAATSLALVANSMLLARYSGCRPSRMASKLSQGYRVVEASFTSPDDVPGAPFDAGHLLLNRADVVAEVDVATLEAAATFPADWR